MSGVEGLGQPSVKAHFSFVLFTKLLKRAGHQDEARFVQVLLEINRPFDFKRGLAGKRHVDQNYVGAKKRNLLDGFVSVGYGLDVVALVGKGEADDLLDR